jgi:hypothetical protein
MDASARAEFEPKIDELSTTITTLDIRLIDLLATAVGPDRDAV